MDKNKNYYSLFEINKDFIQSDIYKIIDMRFLQKIVQVLNTDRKVIISGIDFIGKLDAIKMILRKTKNLEDTLYFNKRLDSENIIKTGNNLKKYINENKSPNTKILVLQNIGEIDEIKVFLRDLFETDYKIIIIGNDIKVNFIKDIEIKQKINSNLNRNIYYGNIGFIGNYNNTDISKINLQLIKDKIILDNIFDLKSVKDIDLYNSTLSFLSKIDTFSSIREMYNDFIKNESIAIKTFTDYIEFTEQSKIIGRVPLYDLKRKKEISTKNRYYFLDNGLLNSINHFRQRRELLIKNLIFIKLYYYNFNISGGRFGTFEFDFYIRFSENKSLALQFSTEDNLKNNINRLKRVGATKKYIIIENLESLPIRKKIYDNLEIISLEEFIKKDLG